MSLDANTAESSPAPASPASLDTLNSEQLTHWRMTGELPGESPAKDSEPPPAESAPAEPAAQATSTDASTPPASDTGKPAKKNAETRKAELSAEIESLLQRRAALRAELDAETARRQPRQGADVSAESSPAPAVSLAQTIQSPDIRQPVLGEDAFFALFPEAKIGDYTRYVARYELAAEKATSQTVSAKQARTQAFVERMTKEGVTGPEYWANIHERVRTLQTLDDLPPGQEPTPYHVIGQEIKESDSPKRLVEHFSEHPELLDQFARLPHAQAIARAIGKLEASLVSPAPAPPPPPVKVTSSAPPPADTLGTKPNVPADEELAALLSGDFDRYRAVVNGRELQRSLPR